MRAIKRKVVIADDEENILSALKETLDKDYSVFSAVNGKQAVEIAERIVPDIVVLDLLMPEMDGLEACRLIRSGKLTAEIPVLLLTAKNQIEFSEKGFASGASSYMVKPFSPEKLLLKVSELIEKAEMRKGIN